MSRTVHMTSGSPLRHIITFALPVLVTNLGQQLYMIADAAIVGRGVGMNALAAVGATDWVYWLVLWAVVGLTQGFATFVSRSFGEKNYRAVNKVIAMSVLLTGVIGSALTLVGIIAARPALELLNTPPDIIDGATTYLMAMIGGTLVVAAYNMAAAILRAFGDSKTPLVAMGIAATLNIGLDLLFVFVFGRGILGAAVASVAAQAVSFLFCLKKLLSVDIVQVDREARRADTALMGRMLLFALPISLQYMVISLGGILLQSSVNLQGSVFIAGYTATNKVYGLLECSATSIGLSCSTFLGQNYGAGLYSRVKKGVMLAIGIVAVMSVGVAALAFIFGDTLLGFFLDSSAADGGEALAVAVRYLNIMASFLLVLYLLHVFQNALQAMAVSLWSMISGIAEGVLRVLMAKVAIHYMGSDALFASEPVAWSGALLCVVIPYLFYSKKLLRQKKEL